MNKMVNCVVLGREAEGLEKAPLPGDIGQKIFSEVSREGWKKWLERQTMLMNEFRLSPIKSEDRAYLEKQMQEFLFGDGGDSPKGWVQQENKAVD
tara:strand:+ start:730 stop:1014 length:285 start_codon:yes stop_codon:yes gene_type:complete